jgi:hypothetical protein
VPTKLIGAIYRDIEIRKEATGINVELSRAIYWHSDSVYTKN